MLILDATCARRDMWLEKNYADAIFVDIRPEVKPQVLADMTKTFFYN